MKIVDIRTQAFNYKSIVDNDSEGHTHPSPEHDAMQTILTVVTDEGAEGYYFGADPSVMESIVKPVVVGEDPMDREKIWQKLRTFQRGNSGLTDQQLSVVDLALWDLAGRHLGQPVYKLLGDSGTRCWPTPAPCAATSCPAA